MTFPSEQATVVGLGYGFKAEQFIGAFETPNEPNAPVLADGYAGYYLGYLPAPSDVVGESYGYQGSQFQGELDPLPPMGCNYPPASDVREGVDRGDGVIGTLYLPVDELSESEPLRLVSGDAYREMVGNAITYVCTTLRDMPSEPSAFKFTVKNQTTGELEVDHLDASSVDVEERLIRFELGSDHTSLDPDDSYRYDVEIHYGTDVVTVRRHKLIVTSNVEACPKSSPN